MLILSASSLQTILAHAERTYPEECCGILLGQISAAPSHNPEKRLVDVIPTQNAWDQEVAAALQAPHSRHVPDAARRDRYWIDPRDLLQAQRTARSRDLQIIGIYHSHPDHPAVPSEMDRQMAWAAYSYVIVSVQQGKAAATLSWQLDAEQQFAAEAVEVRFR